MRTTHPESSRLGPGDRLLFVCDSTDGRVEGLTTGVKRTQQNISAALERQGITVDLLYPHKASDTRSDSALFPSTFELPGQQNLDVVLNPLPVIGYLRRNRPDGIFISTTEGPLGLMTAIACQTPRLLRAAATVPYVASFTTRVDAIVSELSRSWVQSVMDRSPAFLKPLLDAFVIRPQLLHWLLSRLYNAPHSVLVPTVTMMDELAKIGVDTEKKGVLWPRGIDAEMFHPPEEQEENVYEQYEWYRQHPLPVALFFGRVAPEKNIEAFLRNVPSECQAVVIGDGFIRAELEAKYPDARFLGKKFETELAAHIRWADVHVFPSLTDTFGNTILEAGASGVPTVGFRGVPGPQDIVTPGVSGILIDQPQEFPEAIRAASQIERAACAQDIVSRYSWDHSANILLDHLPRAFPPATR